MEPISVAEIMGAFEIVVKVMLYLAIIILFLKQETNRKRVKFTVLIGVILGMIHLFEIPVIMEKTLVMVVLLLFGIPLWISRETALLLMVVLAALPLEQYFWLYLIGMGLYVITIGGLILAALTGK